MIQKNNKKKNDNNLLNILFKSKNFYGDLLKNTNKDILPYVYGVRNNYTIIDLKITAINLKRIFKLIKFTLYKKKKILIIGNSNDINFLINNNFVKNNKNIIYLNKNYGNGFITNNISNINFLKKEINLILIIKSSIYDNYLNQELSLLQIPIIFFINTNQNLKKINYPIISNNKNVQSIFTLMFLLRKLF